MDKVKSARYKVTLQLENESTYSHYVVKPLFNNSRIYYRDRVYNTLSKAQEIANNLNSELKIKKEIAPKNILNLVAPDKSLIAPRSIKIKEQFIHIKQTGVRLRQPQSRRPPNSNKK